MSSPVDLELLKTWPHPRAPQIERRIHRILDEYRWRNEWFDCSQTQAEAAYDQARAEIESLIGTRSERSSTTEVADAIHLMIDTGALSPGDSLPSVGELRSTYSLSATPIRDALQQLAWAGLIETGAGVTARVARHAERAEWSPDGDASYRARLATVQERSELGLRRGGWVIERVDNRGEVEVRSADTNAVVITTRLQAWDEPLTAVQLARRGR